MSSARWKALVQLQEAEIDGALQAGLPMSMGLPEAWYESPYWGCENGHVRQDFTWSGRVCGRGGAVCSACGAPLALLPAGYTDESLNAAIEALL